MVEEEQEEQDQPEEHIMAKEEPPSPEYDPGFARATWDPYDN